MRFETVKQGISRPSARNHIAPRRATEHSSVPDFTAHACIHARRRIAAMLAAGLPTQNLEILFGLDELQFAADDDVGGATQQEEESHR